MKNKEGFFLLVVLYVDDLLITRSSTDVLSSINFSLNKAFAMIDLGLLRQFIGLEVSQKTSRIMISQSRYSLDMLRRFHMEDYMAAPFPFLSSIRLEEGGSTPLAHITLFKKTIGSLLYLTHSRPDISYVVSVVSRYMKEPHELHWKEAKHILHYV